MTGLDLGSDKLIEIAALVTDGELNILGDGIDVVIHADDADLDAMSPVVTDMHTRSGLIDEVRASTVDLATAEAMVLDYIRSHVKQAKTAPLAGNSIVGLVVGGLFIAAMLSAGVALQSKGFSVYIVAALYGLVLAGIGIGEVAARFRVVRPPATTPATVTAERA